MRSTAVSLVLSLAFVAGCEVTASNPNDPASTNPSPGHLDGRLVSASGVTLTGAFVRVSEAGIVTPTVVDPDGRFSAEVKPGVWAIEAGAEGHFTVRMDGMKVWPGARLDVGTQRLVVVRGVVTGRVRLADGAPPEGTSVTLVASDSTGSGLRTWTTNASASGDYRLEDVPEGDYVVRASHLEYAPGYSDAQAVTGEDPAAFGELSLSPASAVVRFEAKGTIGAKSTNDAKVRVLLLAFGDHVREMMLSEDPTFADAAQGDVAWRQYAASVELDLGGDDGLRTVHAKFRDKWGIESPAFSTSIVLDREAPRITTATLGDGSGWVRERGVQTPVAFTAEDTLSGLAGFVVATDGTLDTEAEELRAAPPGMATVATSVALGSVEGPTQLALRVRDAAGNVSEIKDLYVVLDATAPTVGTHPILIDDGAEVVHSREVALTFDLLAGVLDDRLFVAVDDGSGIPDDATFDPLVSPLVWTLNDGPDGSREVCARFRDLARNTTDAHCTMVTLDRTGSVAGHVTLEDGGSTLAGITVTVGSDVDAAFVRTGTTADDGTYSVDDIPEGASYVVRLSRAGYDTQAVRPVTVAAGRATTIDDVALARSRGAVSGTVTLNDKVAGEFGGIVVAAGNSPYVATTSPGGAFLLRDVPVGTYEFVARAQGYVSGTFGTVTVTAAREQALGTLQLRKQSGSFQVCRLGDTLCAQGAVDVIGSRDVLLRLVSTTATQFRVSTREDFAGATPRALEEGRVTYPFTLDDRDGEQPIYVEYRTATNAAQPVISTSVKLDRQPPTGLSIALDADSEGRGAAWTNDPLGHVLASVVATDAISGVATVVLSNDTTFNETPRAFAPVLDHTLVVSSDGPKNVYLSACDRVGNCTTATNVFATIKLDRVKPSAASGYAMKLSNGDALTSSAQVTVDVTYAADAALVRFGTTPTLAGAQWQLLDPTTATSDRYPLLLPIGDGTKTVYAQFADAAGNQSTLEPAAFSDTIDLDTLPPQAPRVTLPASGYTKLSALDVGTSATDATQMQVVAGTVEDFSAATWEAIAATKRVTLATDGTWKVFARFRDAAGNVSSVASGQVIRDTVAPALPSLSIVEGAYSPSQLVNLRLFASGADEMVLSSDGTIDTEEWEPYATARAFSLVPVGASPYSMKAMFRDRALNDSPVVSVQVSVDKTPPTLDVKINGAAAGGRTKDANVTLTLTAADATGLGDMEVANDSAFAGASRAKVSTTLPWRLDASGVDGLRTVWVRVYDLAGNTVSASATITLDRTAPAGTVAIQQGALTNSRTVNLQFTRDPDVTSISVANGALDCATATYENWPAGDQKVWSLPAGDGARTVVTCFRDLAGNASSASASTTLDTTAPVAAVTPVIQINGGATTTTTVAVSLRLRVTGADTMRVSCDDALDTEVAQPFQADVSCSLNATQGRRTVTASFADAANNVLGPVTANIDLDTLLPPVPVTTAVTSPTNLATIPISWTSGGGDTASFRLQISSTIDFASVNVEPPGATSPYTWAPTEGSWYFRVAARDAAGNTSPWTTPRLVRVDRTAPSTPTLTASPTATTATFTWVTPGDDVDDRNLAPGSTIDLRWVPSGSAFVFASATQATGEPAPGAQGSVGSYVLTLLQPKTNYDAAARVCDAAGNCSGVSSTVSLRTGDETPPESIPDLAATLGDHSVTLTWTNPGDDDDAGGPVTLQEVLYRNGPLATAQDQQLADIQLVKVPGAPGTQGSAVVTGLPENSRYAFAVRSTDAAGLRSVSNVLTVPTTRLDDLRPASAAPGDWVEIEGLNLGTSQAIVSFAGVQATEIASWSNTLVRVQVPERAGSGEVRLVRGVLASDARTLTLKPRLTAVYPREVLAGGRVYLSGSDFGAKTDSQTSVMFGATQVAASGLADWQDGGGSLVVPALSPGLYMTRVKHLGLDSRASPLRVWAAATDLTDGTSNAYAWGAASSMIDGAAFVAYTYDSGVNKLLRSRRLGPTGTAWDAAEDPTGGLTNIVNADVDVDRNGTAHYCWVSRRQPSVNNYAVDVQYRSRTAGAAWGTLRTLRTLTQVGSYPLYDNCRVAAATQGSSGVAAVLVVWTEGNWSSSVTPSRLWGAESIDGGANFSPALNVCPDGGCVGTLQEGLPDVTAYNSRYGKGFYLTYGRRNGAAGLIDLKVAYAGPNPLVASLGFGSPVLVSAALPSSFGPPSLATVDTWYGWNDAAQAILAWNDANGRVWAWPLASGSISSPPTEANFVLVDSAAAGGLRPTITASVDADVSLVIPSTSLVQGSTMDHVLRHHRLRWAEGSKLTAEDGDEVSGMSAFGNVVATAGANGRLAVVWGERPGAATLPKLRGTVTRVPRRETTPVTLVATPAGTQLTSPEATVSPDGTLFTVYWEQAGASAPFTLSLKAVRETAAGAVTIRLGSAIGTGTISGPYGCDSTSTCRDLTAVTATPSNTAAVLWVSPVASGTQTLRLCADIMTCATNQLDVATGSFAAVALASDPTGNLHLVYARQGTPGGIFYKRLKSGALSAEVQVNALASGVVEPGIAAEPSVVGTPAGGAFVFYRRSYGLDSLRVRSISMIGQGATLAAVRGEAVELAASASGLERPSAAWGQDGIELAWREGGARVQRARWLESWLVPPTLVGQLGGGLWTALADANGQSFVVLDSNIQESWDTFASSIELDRLLHPAISLGPASDATRGYTAPAVDPRGRLLMLSTCRDYGPCGDLQRVSYSTNEW